MTLQLPPTANTIANNSELRIIHPLDASTMQRQILKQFSRTQALSRVYPTSMTRRPFVFAFAVFSAATQGADVSRRPWARTTRPALGKTFVTESYEHLLRGGADADAGEQPRSLIESYDTSVCSVQGARNYQEDEYLINQNGAFAAVFDGHGGNAVSRYLRQNLYANVQAAAPVLKTVEECTDALKAALKKVDSEVQRISHWSFQGSTAVAVWVVSEDRLDEEPRRTVIAANVGDSRAVMCRNGAALDLTVDHKPNTDSEKARVEALGGKVVWCGMVDEDGIPVPNAGIYRVNGNLALSRAIGDRSERPAVTSKPDMTTYDVEDDDEFIILGSDGLWDVMSSQEAVSFVQDTLRDSGPVLEGSSKASLDSEIQEDESDSESEPASTYVQNRIADLLVAEALKRGTTDNVTVVLMWLKLKTV